MTQDKIHARVREELACAQVSSSLKRRTLEAAMGKDERIMKRKTSVALVFVLAAMLLGGAALAAATRWGMSDFWRQYEESYVPEDAAQYIQTDLSTTGTNHATIDVKELYYDGRSVYLTVDVTPKSDKLLLIPDYLSIANDGWENLTKEAAAEGAQVKTILEVWQERGYQDVMAVSADVLLEDGESMQPVTDSMDAVFSEDNPPASGDSAARAALCEHGSKGV